MTASLRPSRRGERPHEERSPPASALTISAPAIGRRSQTVITSRTERNSAPTSPPKTSASPTFAAIAPAALRRPLLHGQLVRLAGRRWRASATAAIGAWTMKIARQSASCVSTPPSAGPSAAPNVPVAVQIRAPRCGPPPSSPPSIGQRPGEQQRAAEPLDAAEHDQRREAPRRRAADRADREQREPDPRHLADVQPARERDERERRDERRRGCRT